MGPESQGDDRHSKLTKLSLAFKFDGKGANKEAVYARG